MARKGGPGANTGKKAVMYTVTLPDGSQHKKRVLVPHEVRDHIATAFKDPHSGKIHVAVWVHGAVSWEGDFGRLVAKPAEVET